MQHHRVTRAEGALVTPPPFSQPLVAVCHPEVQLYGSGKQVPFFSMVLVSISLCFISSDIHYKGTENDNCVELSPRAHAWQYFFRIFPTYAFSQIRLNTLTCRVLSLEPLDPLNLLFALPSYFLRRLLRVL
jgi:hypothetical protein